MQEFKKFAVRGPVIMTRESVFERKSETEVILVFTTNGNVDRGTVEILVRKVLGVKTEQIKLVFVPSYPSESFSLTVKRSLGTTAFSVLLALGGGSVIDVAKHFCANYAKNVRLIAVPTLAGSGSETNCYSAFWDFELQKKSSIKTVAPHKVILEPSLTLSCPMKITLSGAFDALSHALDSLWNKNKSPRSQYLSLEAIELIIHALPKLHDNLSDLNARESVMLASHLAGKAIAINQTSLAHSMSYQLTLNYRIDHGLACGVFLPGILRNIDVTSVGLSPFLVEKILDLYKLIDWYSYVFCKFEKDHFAKKYNRVLCDERVSNFILKAESDYISTILEDSIKFFDEVNYIKTND